MASSTDKNNPGDLLKHSSLPNVGLLALVALLLVGLSALPAVRQWGNAGPGVTTSRPGPGLESELEQSVESLAYIAGARVHLVFSDKAAKGRSAQSASVVVRLASGDSLEPRQVDAITDIVSSGIPGLESGRVTVVDQLGRLFNGSSGPRRLEDAYVARIEHILAPVVDSTAVRVQVHIDDRSSNPEQVDAKGKAARASSGFMSDSAGRLSIAVLLDDKLVQDKKGELVRRARTAEELERITGLVKSAVGFSSERGDRIQVLNMPFVSAEPLSDGRRLSFAVFAWTGLGVLLAAVAVVWRKRRSPRRNGLEEKQIEPQSIESYELDGAQSDLPPGCTPHDRPRLLGPDRTLEDRVETLREMAKQDPQKFAQLIRELIASQ